MAASLAAIFIASQSIRARFASPKRRPKEFLNLEAQLRVGFFDEWEGGIDKIVLRID